MWSTLWHRLTHVNVPDPDDARRRRLLNIVLIGLSAIALILMISTIIYFSGFSNALNFLITGFLLLLFNLGLYFLNRRVSGILAGGLFVSILIVLIAISDSPQELVTGRSLLFFSVPIVFSGVLLRPWMVFGIALFCSLVNFILARQVGIEFNTFAVAGFFTLAFLSWLSAQGIENALADLRNTNRELDERVRLRTQELAHANEQLKELDRLRSKFVADVSHELRTPVSNLVAYLEMFENRINDPERRKRYLSILQEETLRLQKMVTSVLKIARMETKTEKQFDAPVSLNEVAEQIVLAHQSRAEAHGLMIDFEPGKLVPIIWVDQDKINQIVNNIIGNAVNYTPSGGSIRVRTYIEEDKVVFEVTDTGIGIPAENLPYIFERFYRADNTGSSIIAGTGLGLAITKELVDAYQGSIEVVSELGKGTTFRVFLPVTHELPLSMNESVALG